MGDNKGVSEAQVEGDKPQKAADSTDRPQIDTIAAMTERAELAKSDETHTKVKKFTLGDGGFGIDGLEQAGQKSVSDTKAATSGRAAGGDDIYDETEKRSVKKVTETESGTVTEFANGIKLTKNNDGQVTSTHRPDGSTTNFKYDGPPPTGNVMEISRPGGDAIRRNDDDTFSRFDKDGHVIPGVDGALSTPKGAGQDITVDDQGRISYIDPDGSKQITNPDRSKISLDSDGNPTKFVSAREGTQKAQDYQVNSDGSMEHMLRPTDTLGKISRDVLKFQHREDANYQPSPKEVQDEMRRIAKANGLENYDLLPTDAPIRIPAPGKA